MTRLRRSFTAEFKLEAASPVLDQDILSPKQAVHWMSVKPYCAAGFSNCNPNRCGTTPIGKALTPEQQKFRSWKPVSTGSNVKRTY